MSQSHYLLFFSLTLSFSILTATLFCNGSQIDPQRPVFKASKGEIRKDESTSNEEALCLVEDFSSTPKEIKLCG